MMKPILRKKLLGGSKNNGALKLLLYYIILIGIGFVYIYPILYMLINSFMSSADINDPAVYWLPTELYFGNFVKAFNTLDFVKSFGYSLIMSGGPAILQTIVTAMAGYALARFDLPGKTVWTLLIIFTFLVPVQITNIPKYILFNDMHILNTIFPFYLPALFGQGLRSAIFVLIFMTYFGSYPKSFDEAASLDGAGKFKIFTKIALPMSTSAIILCLIFSFVWYWNETIQANLFFGSDIKTLPLQLANFTTKYEALYGKATLLTGSVNESITLAGTLLSILPTVILYLFVQKQMVQSIERTGITGE